MRFFLSLLIAALLPLSSPAGAGITFVVNRDNPARSLSAKELAELYRKKRRFWPDGTPVRFIDRNPGTPEREIFSRRILRQTEAEVDLFWVGQKLYTGDSAPLQVASDAAVLRMVRIFKGAIGYVSSGSALDSGSVKVIDVSMPPGEN
ncbi:MAG: substrate-binding domain-containing protein [Oligoflexia bacterium]|nr:substrate-binding domain-containing protein [Oligoflexia bacterium]